MNALIDYHMFQNQRVVFYAVIDALASSLKRSLGSIQTGRANVKSTASPLYKIITRRVRCECSDWLTCVPKPARRVYAVKLTLTCPVLIDPYYDQCDRRITWCTPSGHLTLEQRWNVVEIRSWRCSELNFDVDPMCSARGAGTLTHDLKALLPGWQTKLPHLARWIRPQKSKTVHTKGAQSITWYLMFDVVMGDTYIG